MLIREQDKKALLYAKLFVRLLKIEFGNSKVHVKLLKIICTDPLD